MISIHFRRLTLFAFCHRLISSGWHFCLWKNTPVSSYFFLVFVFRAGERKKPGACWATKEEKYRSAEG